MAGRAPSVLRRTWVEQTERVLKGLEAADTVRVGSDAVQFVRRDQFEVMMRQRCSPIRRVSKTGDRYVVFCGAENEDYIADTRLEFDVFDDGRAVFISDVVSKGYQPSEPALFSWGRFGPPVRSESSAEEEQ